MGTALARCDRICSRLNLEVIKHKRLVEEAEDFLRKRQEKKHDNEDASTEAVTERSQPLADRCRIKEELAKVAEKDNDIRPKKRPLPADPKPARAVQRASPVG